MSIKFVDLPDTITPEDYAKWRGIGLDHARNRFHAFFVSSPKTTTRHGHTARLPYRTND